ncbi:alpha/beta fold hydrolase [Hymenobacter sp. BRD128]|uniref:alpha/beta fold hydrolase n=1 Tax=Hymenobacter sp. BRD128 TaxID=2675878 RepID=UPI001C265F4F|nr:alpha/beta fold hydrolase [Hymenobacter sp. BRD128]
MPDNSPPKASVLLLHGMAEHRQRYADFARYLTQQGFAVLAYDQLGHGCTAQTPAELGFFQLTAPAEQVVQDAEQMAALVAGWFPGVPHFVLGHSMGSFVARCLLQQAGNQFEGAVLVGTAAGRAGAGFGRALLSVLNKAAPRRRPRLLTAIFEWLNNRQFKEPGPPDATRWLSVDQPNRAAFAQDPLCGIPFTNNGFYTLLSLMVRATRAHWPARIPQALPLLLVSGENDPVGEFGQGVRRVARQLQQAGFRAVRVVLYPGMRHEILQEVIKPRVYHDIAGWLTTLVDQAPTSPQPGGEEG